MGNWCHFPLLIGVISSHYIITGSEAHLVFVQINWTLQTDVFENSGDRILEILDVSPDSLWAPLFFAISLQESLSTYQILRWIYTRGLLFTVILLCKYPRHPNTETEVRYLDPNIPKTPNLMRYDWMSRDRQHLVEHLPPHLHGHENIKFPNTKFFGVLLATWWFNQVCLVHHRKYSAKGDDCWMASFSLKLTASLHLKINGWKMKFPFGMAYFQGLC